MEVVFCCDPDWIRTNGLLLRRQLLYPAELPDQYSLFSVRCSILTTYRESYRTKTECEFTNYFHSHAYFF